MWHSSQTKGKETKKDARSGRKRVKSFSLLVFRNPVSGWASLSNHKADSDPSCFLRPLQAESRFPPESFESLPPGRDYGIDLDAWRFIKGESLVGES